MQELWNKFVQERLYLKGVTRKTLRWYECSWQAFKPLDNIEGRIIELRQAGVKPISINTYLGAVNAFHKWAHENNHVPALKKWKKLKTEKKVIPVLTEQQIQALASYKNRKRKLWVLAMLLLDTGLRVDEALGLRREDIDFDNLLLRVDGKGQKQRFVPFSFEMRKILYKFCAEGINEGPFLSAKGTKLTQRYLLRDFKKLCKKLGISGVRCSWHTLRHTFAVCYLKKGGNLFYLSRTLGHSDIKTTQRYLQAVGLEDIQKVHSRFSPLGPLRK